MKHWIIVLVVVLIAFIAIGYLHDQGYLDVQWQWLAMAFAVLAGPYKFLKNSLFGGDKKITDILKGNEAGRKEDVIHREKFDQEIKEKEARVAELEKQIELMDVKLQLLEEKKKKLPEQVNKMNVTETKDEFTDLYGS